MITVCLSKQYSGLHEPVRLGGIYPSSMAIGTVFRFVIAVDALGNPVRLLLTPGQASEYGQAEALLNGFTPDQVLADKGYDSDAFVESIQRVGAEAVIPSRKNRQQPRPLDRHIYKDRNLVERFFQKLKQFRRVATRYERLAKNYQSMLSLVSAVIWLA